MQSNDFFASCATRWRHPGCYDRFLRIIKGEMTLPLFNNRSTMNTNFYHSSSRLADKNELGRSALNNPQSLKPIC